MNAMYPHIAYGYFKNEQLWFRCLQTIGRCRTCHNGSTGPSPTRINVKNHYSVGVILYTQESPDITTEYRQCYPLT